jgi:hypothetical protein
MAVWNSMLKVIIISSGVAGQHVCFMLNHVEHILPHNVETQHQGMGVYTNNLSGFCACRHEHN